MSKEDSTTSDGRHLDGEELVEWREMDQNKLKLIETKLLDFDGVTRLDIDADKIINEALGKCDGVIIVGRGKDGESYYASSIADGAEILWDIKKFEKYLMEEFK